jgi:hypothetical protein
MNDILIPVINDFTECIRTFNAKKLNEMDSIVCRWKKIERTETYLSDALFKSIVNNWKIPDISRNLHVAQWEEWFAEYQEDERRHRADGHNFNVFALLKEELGFHVSEYMHGRLIRFLLDGQASHGQGDNFLLEFLKHLSVDSPERGEWNVTIEAEKSLILLYRTNPESIIVLQNGSNTASDTVSNTMSNSSNSSNPHPKNSLYEFWHDWIFAATGEVSADFYEHNCNRYQLVRLTSRLDGARSEPNLARPEEFSASLPAVIPMSLSSLKTLTYSGDIRKWLDACIEALPETNFRLREYIGQYQTLCKTL